MEWFFPFGISNLHYTVFFIVLTHIIKYIDDLVLRRIFAFIIRLWFHPF